MILTDLYLFTQTLLNLLNEALENSYTISSQAPDLLPDGTHNTISVFLYHAREDTHRKNIPSPTGTGPVALSPLALSLFYVVTAHHHDADNKPVPEVEQKLMGYALKALHDYPILSDATEIDGTQILPSDLRGHGTHLSLNLRPIQPEEAVTFWNGDDQRIIRFSAFYELRVALLAAEKPTSYPGYVLSVGNYILPTGVMHIASTHGVIRFTPPGGSEVAVPSSPARVAIQTTPAGTHNQLILRGSRLSGSQLVLRSPLAPGDRLVVDAALNPAWEIKVSATQITCRVQPLVHTISGDVAVLPGIYGVSAQLTTQHPGKTLVSRSNEQPVALTPFVVDVVSVSGTPAALVTLSTSNDTDLTQGALLTEIEVFVSGLAYERVTDPPAAPQQFSVLANQLKLKTHFGDDDAGIYPVRVVVRGAESRPIWIEVAP